MKHAYLIIAHNEWELLNRLIKALDYPENDIYLHIDKKVDFNYNKVVIPEYSKLIYTKRMNISWGGESQIKCVLSMLKMARVGKYRYYHLLSGVDIPLKNQTEIHNFFECYNGENFLSFDRKRDYSKIRLREYHYFQDYIGRNKGYLSAVLYKIETKLIEIQKWVGINRLKNVKWKFFKGEQWFSITDQLVDEILQDIPQIKKIFFNAICADEMYIQTIAMNSTLACTIVEDDLRYIDWVRGNPYVFTNSDYDLICNSNKMFARKFSSEVDLKIVERLYERLNK